MTASLGSRVSIVTKARESAAELFLKSEQLLRFRIAFALVSLVLCVGIATLAGSELAVEKVAAIVGGVSIYSFIGLAFIVKRLRNETGKLRAFNALLITLDTMALTCLVHFTRGIESDLYVLYLLPILLSSYTFGKRGIYFSALLVTISYIGLLVFENAELLPYVLSAREDNGLAAAYSGNLWRRILGRAFFFASVSLLWARFCDYMSRVARKGAERLLEQLDANEKLVADSEARAKRERLINSINKAVRSTIETDKVFEIAVMQLAQAVKADVVAIVCMPFANPVSNPFSNLYKSGEKGGGRRQEELVIVEETTDKKSDQTFLPPNLCMFLLGQKGAYEVEKGEKVKTFNFTDPADNPLFAPVKSELQNIGLRSLVVQPMMYGEVSRGIIILGDRDGYRNFNESDLVLTKVVAGQVAVAIEHANLVAELSRKNRDLVGKNINLDAKNSELKTMQSQLIHHEKMASLGRLVAGIAHELNNPINFVHGNLPYLRQYVDELKKVIEAMDQVPEEHRKPVEDLKNKLKYDFLVTDLDNIIADLNEGAERIRHIIKNLRSFSRLDEAELKEASVREGIESTLKILSQYYGKDKIAVDANFDDLPQILCYPGQLNQVWMNLLGNAAQAMSHLSEPVLHLSGTLEGDFILVSIKDSGTGIKPEVQSKIFDPFFTTKPVGQGTGLGLSICHSIIERHGGQIWFESQENKGTTFFVRLPLVARKQELEKIGGDLFSDPD